MAGRKPLHQFIAGASPGDAITDQALLLRGWLRQWGFDAEIYAEHADAALDAEVRPALSYRPRRNESLLIYHHSIGSALVPRLARLARPLLLIYHNVTPPHFLAAVDPARAQRAAVGQQQLAELQPHTRLALADSPFNQAELAAAGFRRCGVLPITLDEARYRQPEVPAVTQRHAGHDPLLLFVGRLAPNKRQEDLIKLLYHLRRLRPQAHLALVGDAWMPAYAGWLQDFARQLGVAEALTVTGRVSQAEMVAYYRRADLYVSMSDHEGFGKPLIESMYLALPVLAYASSAVPGTLGDAGVLFHRKAYPELAQLVDLILSRPELRRQLIRRGRERVQHFLPEQVAALFRSQLQELGLVAEEQPG